MNKYTVYAINKIMDLILIVKNIVLYLLGAVAGTAILFFLVYLSMYIHHFFGEVFYLINGVYLWVEFIAYERI